MEAGSPIGWHRWAGDEGVVIGVERFGASAPGQDVLTHLGFTADHVAAAALRLLAGTTRPIRNTHPKQRWLRPSRWRNADTRRALTAAGADDTSARLGKATAVLNKMTQSKHGTPAEKHSNRRCQRNVPTIQALSTRTRSQLMSESLAMTHCRQVARHRLPAPLFREDSRWRLGQNSFTMLTAMSTAIWVPSCSAALDALRFPG